MRVLIIGNLAGQLSAATKIAFDKGAKVLHAHDAATAMELLRTGRGADIVMIDVHEDIRSLVNAMKQERIVAPVVACGVVEHVQQRFAGVFVGDPDPQQLGVQKRTQALRAVVLGGDVPGENHR